MLNARDPNFYHIQRSDFTAPSQYNLYLIKNTQRSKVKAFLPTETKCPEQAITRYQQKFLGQTGYSSQINCWKGNRARNIFQKNTAGQMTAPHMKDWQRTPTVPLPVYVNVSDGPADSNK